MGDGDKHVRQTARFDGRKLAELTKQARSAEPAEPWSDRANPGTPTASPLATSRTTTLDDPFTTSLLAEVARRSRTIELSPAQIDDAMTERDRTSAGQGPGVILARGNSRGMGLDPGDPDPSDDPT